MPLGDDTSFIHCKLPLWQTRGIFLNLKLLIIGAKRFMNSIFHNCQKIPIVSVTAYKTDGKSSFRIFLFKMTNFVSEILAKIFHSGVDSFKYRLIFISSLQRDFSFGIFLPNGIILLPSLQRIKCRVH